MLDSIPAELLARIVDLACPSTMPLSSEQIARYALLRSLSLVNKTVGQRAQHAVTTLSIIVEPGEKPREGEFAEPVEEDLQILAKLPNVQTLVVRTEAVVVGEATKSWESDPFAFSKIQLDVGAEIPLRRLDSLFVMNGVLDLRNLGSACSLSLTHLALCGFLYSETSLYKLLSPNVLPNLRQLRLGPVRREEGAMATSWLKLPKITKDFLDQLDFLEVGQRTYFGHGPLPKSYTATPTPTLVMMDEFLDKLPHLKAAFVERSHKGSQFAECFHDYCTERGVEVVWCDAEEYEFILPEFEAFIRRSSA